MCDYRESHERWEWANLAPYASHSSDPSLSWRRSDKKPRKPDKRFVSRRASSRSSDRSGDDPAGSLSRFKTSFQIDKERIAGSNAFRRLEYKTQVFVSHEGDHFRTRLTHTVEVNETARFISQALRLNCDLVEAIALGHDLGHPPFGHVGEETLHQLFAEAWERNKLPSTDGYCGAFYHNVQSVRVVDSLEKGYEWDLRPPKRKSRPARPACSRGRGLDLTWAVREGILKHSSRGLRLGSAGSRMFGSQYLMDELDPFRPATLEGLVVEYADEVASLMHDLEDGMRSCLFKKKHLVEVIREHIIKPGTLANLLGLGPEFDRDPDDDDHAPRVAKLRKLLRRIDKDKDCTVGSVLAFLRSVLMSNLIEASHMRLRKALGGEDSPKPSSWPKPRGLNELVWIELQVGTDCGPTTTSYCPEGWDLSADDLTNRVARVHRFRHRRGSIVPDGVYEGRDVHITWVSKSRNPADCTRVLVDTGGVPVTYPLESVCITFSGAKLVGYHSNIQQLRDHLRKQFIPDHLHDSPVVLRMGDKGRRFLTRLFERYWESPKVMHRSALERFGMWPSGPGGRPGCPVETFLLRIVEHLQGMTDRYLTDEYHRLFLPGHDVAERDELSIVHGGKRPW